MSSLSIVTQLIKGFAREEQGVYRATGSVSLVRNGPHLILVDCGDPWNGAEIVEKLKGEGFSPEEVTTVVVTHGHLDHCANLGLFQRATVYMGTDYAKEGVYSTLEQNKPHPLCEGVDLLMMKGHTECDLVVVARETPRGCIVVAGDLFECEKDDDVWKELSRYPTEHEESREKIREMADYIVPGHGPMFKNDRK